MPFVKKIDSKGSQPSTDGQKVFIGRNTELHIFTENILKPKDPTYNIVSVSGQGGVGKSTLLTRFIEEARTPDFKDYCLMALVDERQTTPASMMEKLADQLPMGSDFEKALRQYKEVLHKLQDEREAAREALLRKTTADIAGAVVKDVPFIGGILQEGVGAATGYLFDELRYRQMLKDAERLEDPVGDLTRAFVSELNLLTDTYVPIASARSKHQLRVILFFDTFEQLAAEAAPWLLNSFLEANISNQVVLVIAGRDPLERSTPDDLKRWLPYHDDGTIYSIALNSFTEEETRAYLFKIGITDPARIHTIWQLSRGLPLYLGLLTANPLGKVDPMKDVVDNFLRWIPEQEQVKRRLALDGALFSKPFNLDDLEAFTYLSENDRPILYRWLSEQPFVRSNTQDGRYIYHDLAKELFSRHFYQRSKKGYYATRRALTEHYQRLLEEVQMAGGQGVYDPGEWLDLTIAVAYQLFLLPDEVSHFKAIVQVLKVNDYVDTDEQKGEIVKFLHELSREHATNLAGPGARQVVEQMLHYIEAARRSQERVTAIAPLLEKAVHIPSFPPELLAYLYSEQGWAYFYLHFKGYQQAIADFECALQLDPRCASAYNGRGWSYLNLKQYQQARPDFDRAIELNSNEAGAYNGRGIIYRAFKDYQQAKADFDRFIKVRPKNAWAYVQHGQTCTLLKEYEQAIADFNRALELDPDYTAAYEGLRQVYVELKEHQQAASILDHLREMNPESSKAYTQWGWTYFTIGEYQQAIADFNCALELNADFANAYTGRGWAYYNLKDIQRAKADFDRALELDPNDGAAYNGRGRIYMQLKEYQLALADCDRFIEGNPNNYWARFQRGQTYLRLKEIRQARADFTKSWELDSTIVWNGWMTEWTRMCQERPDSGMAERLDTIAARDPQDYWAHVCSGVAQWLRGRFEKALAEIERAIALKPKMWGWDAYFWKGMACASLGQYEEALASIENALALELPPVLLAPLCWFEQQRPDFYQKYVVPWLAKFEEVDNSYQS